jgi:hypothetical protein
MIHLMLYGMSHSCDLFVAIYYSLFLNAGLMKDHLRREGEESE